MGSADARQMLAGCRKVKTVRGKGVNAERIAADILTGFKLPVTTQL